MSKYNEIKAALLGAGTVGGGVYKLIENGKVRCQARYRQSLRSPKFW